MKFINFLAIDKENNIVPKHTEGTRFIADLTNGLKPNYRRVDTRVGAHGYVVTFQGTDGSMFTVTVDTTQPPDIFDRFLGDAG
jgi:hypothetical protein